MMQLITYSRRWITSTGSYHTYSRGFISEKSPTTKDFEFTDQARSGNTQPSFMLTPLLIFGIVVILSCFVIITPYPLITAVR
ncbi:hypothetical protein QTP88_006029 [Uroleucon formosanum]